MPPSEWCDNIVVRVKSPFDRLFPAVLTGDWLQTLAGLESCIAQARADYLAGETGPQARDDQQQLDELKRTLTEGGQYAAAKEVANLPDMTQDVSSYAPTPEELKAEHDTAFAEAAISGHPLGG